MRFIPTCALLLSLSAVPAFCQSSNPSSTSTVLPADANDSSVDYSALRERLAAQNKTLQDQVNIQRATVKKNQALLKEAQKLDASNKKLMEEKKKLETENTDLEKQRMALKASEKSGDTALAANGSSN
jgi:septal ring factor EnvC (AmiA/AmiB activator)